MLQGRNPVRTTCDTAEGKNRLGFSSPYFCHHKTCLLISMQRSEATNLAVQLQIMSKHTSFLAVDTRIALCSEVMISRSLVVCVGRTEAGGLSPKGFPQETPALRDTANGIFQWKNMWIVHPGVADIPPSREWKQVS